MRSYYEQIHRFPELGKEEFKTAEFLRKKLAEFGYRNLQTVKAAPTTVIAVLDSGKPGATICFRAEMDARKCQERTALPYASTIAGVMHNCGHDAHAAILLETARRLMLERHSLTGKIVFLFQPAEECPGGADDIVADGILSRLTVRAIFAQHCSPGLTAGKHTLRAGPCLAGSSTLNIKLSGKGGHAAQPHERDDLAGLASLVVLELERLPSRRLDVIQYPAVCAVTTSRWSSEQVNVASESVTLGGTVRAFFGMDDKLFHGRSFRDLVNQLVKGLADAYGVQAEISLKAGVPPTVNDPVLCKKIAGLLDEKGIHVGEYEKGMFAEDFSYYGASIPSAYFGLGIAGNGRGTDNVHSSKFNIDEACLEDGVNLFVTLAKCADRMKLKD